MRDYWLVKFALSAVGLGYLALVIVALTLALWLPKRRVAKATTVLVILAFALFPLVRAKNEGAEQEARAQELTLRYQSAEARFQARCKGAGEKVYRIVDEVDGVALLKVRQPADNKADPMMLGAASAHENFGDDYIRSFLLHEQDGKSYGRQLTETGSPLSLPGYRYVDVFEADGSMQRYTLAPDKRLKRDQATDLTTRYAVTFEDIVDPEDRKYWIASSIVRVMDLRTSETLGELVRYVIEPGQGSLAGGRAPWSFAKGCNLSTSYGRNSPRLFATQVARPSQEKAK